MKDTSYHNLVTNLEAHYNDIVRVYGEPSNVDGNGKIEVVFHEQPNMEGLGGYFSPLNLKREYARSVNMDIIYISSANYIGYTRLSIISNIYFCQNVIFHELQHDINAIRKYKAENWLNEALSESTHFIVNKNRWLGFGRYSDFTTNYIRNGSYFFYWPNEGRIMSENYTTSHFFMYWLYIHGGGENIIKDIVNSDGNKKLDLKSISAAARKNISFFNNVNNDSTVPYTWYQANFRNESSGIYGYLGKIKITNAQANESSREVVLQGYCAVYTSPNMYEVNSKINGLTVQNITSTSGKVWLLIFNNKNYPIKAYINPDSAETVRYLNMLNYDIDDFYDVIITDEEEKGKLDVDGKPPENLEE